MAGAAHLLKDNAGVLRGTHGEQKSPVEQKGKSPLDFDFSVNTNHESVAYRSFSPSEFEARGARKVTTGMNCYLIYNFTSQASSRFEV